MHMLSTRDAMIVGGDGELSPLCQALARNNYLYVNFTLAAGESHLTPDSHGLTLGRRDIMNFLGMLFNFYVAANEPDETVCKKTSQIGGEHSS